MKWRSSIESDPMHWTILLRLRSCDATVRVYTNAHGWAGFIFFDVAVQWNYNLAYEAFLFLNFFQILDFKSKPK